MSELRKAAEKAMGYLADYTVGESPNASEVNDLIADLDAALAQPEPIIKPEIKPDKAAAQEIERLRAALRYEENRFSRIGTHGPDCWKWGPSHYECTLRQIGGQP